MSGLYDLSADLLAINNELVDADGELTPEREAALERVRQHLPQKEAQYVRWYQNVRAEEAAFDAEIERLRRQRDARRHLLEFIKNSFHAHMDQHELTRIETPIGAVRLQKNSQPKLEHTLRPRLELGEASADMPLEVYDLVPEHFELNEKRLREYLNQGKSVSGATLTQGSHIRIG